MISHLFSGATIGFDGHLIEIECDSTRGLPALQIVGLGSKAISEARERVRSAVTNAGFSFPARRITINLAPADLPKHGTHFDLPIALAILVVSGQLRAADTADTLFAGELALDGTLRPVRGALHLAELARTRGFARVILPAVNVAQASMVEGIQIIGLTSLNEVFRYLKGETHLAANPSTLPVPASHDGPFLDDVHGQDQAKRALAIAAAGHHNILLSGPPGAGKTMLANVLAGLLPPFTTDDIIATTKIHSLTDRKYDDIITTPPFRAPHHSASRASIIGGGNALLPGEISLAHGGVLFLDELPEYSRDTLEALRQPLEDKKIRLTRTAGSATFPADFMLVATSNPCPCGYLGDPVRPCHCTPGALQAYGNRLSGPLLDRIDLVVHVGRVPRESFLAGGAGHGSHDDLKRQVVVAREIQIRRLGPGRTNSSLNNGELKRLAGLEADARELLLTAAKTLDLSARAYFRTLRVARTIADLEGSERIAVPHISEALQYRLPAAAP